MVLCSSIGEESLCKQIFEKYVMQLKEQAKEREYKRKEEKVSNELHQSSLLPYYSYHFYFLHSTGKEGKGKRGRRQEKE